MRGPPALRPRPGCRGDGGDAVWGRDHRLVLEVCVMDIGDLLHAAIERKASDLHLKAGTPAALRITGKLVRHGDGDSLALTPEELREAFEHVTTKNQREEFARKRELDFAYSVRGLARFRVNAALQRGTISLVFRQVNWKIPLLEELGLPEVCKVLALKSDGLILVTGPTGCGKSTTLAAMLDYLNEREPRRVVTVEDPIEYLFKDKQCFITQRELGADTESFAIALKHVLRQDPDVILVGEMRDLETIATALTAAETGHLVFATLHTPSASQAIDRIIDVFPPYQQSQIRAQLSIALNPQDGWQRPGRCCGGDDRHHRHSQPCQGGEDLSDAQHHSDRRTIWHADPQSGVEGPMSEGVDHFGRGSYQIGQPRGAAGVDRRPPSPLSRLSRVGHVRGEGSNFTQQLINR